MVSSALTLAPDVRPMCGRAILARRTAISPGNGPGFTPGRGGSSSSCLGGVRLVVAACTFGPHLPPVLRDLLCVFLGLLCASLWVYGGPPGTAVAVCCVRKQRCRMCAVGPPKTRAWVCVWCSQVLVSVHVPWGRFWARIVSGLRVSVTQRVSRVGDR